ncbi:MAG TPA: hypothetical protein VM639_24470 [Dongiaceae bacterium]|nr:hypothetical protein [Dongiaceae bacterium]
MKALYNSELDKKAWGHGPWLDEPDKRQWVDEATNLDCLMVRNHSGVWCGYVGVSEGHPSFGKDYDDVPVDAHGGLTFAAFCREDAGEFGICHVPEAGRPHRIWWLGFDCAHAGDQTPASDARCGWAAFRDDVYRDDAYVQAEVTQLARQLKDIAKRGYIE